MHARTARRRNLWIAGFAAVALAGAALSPIAGVAVGAVAALVLVGNAMRPSSDFYLRSLRRAPMTSHGVALTFDDGPDPERTPQVLAALRETGARATFFMIGRRACASPEIVRLVIDGGHEIGGHSHTHDRTLPFRHRARQSTEIRACMDALANAGAPAARWYRVPMGFATPWITDALAETTLRSVNWSVHARDLAVQSEDRIVERVLSRVRGGDIVLLHDGSDRRGPGPDALPGAVRRIVHGLRERGLAPMTLTELVASAPPTAVPGRTVDVRLQRCGDAG